RRVLRDETPLFHSTQTFSKSGCYEKNIDKKAQMFSVSSSNRMSNQSAEGLLLSENGLFIAKMEFLVGTSSVSRENKPAEVVLDSFSFFSSRKLASFFSACTFLIISSTS